MQIATEPGMSQAEHAAWWGSLSNDDQLVASCPSGYWIELLLAAVTKRWLQSDSLPVAERLQFLTTLADMSAPGAGNMTTVMTHEAVAAIEPANDEVAEIVEAALKLGSDDDSHHAGLDLLARWSVFTSLLRMQPSLMDAIKLMRIRPVAVMGV
jgi:hypothetical protein